MIQCDKCQQLFNDGEELIECIEVKYNQLNNEDSTEFTSMANVWRFCSECWKNLLK